MGNMSYCRFQNTAKDLSDCQDALEDLISGEGAPLSRDELRAAKELVEHCLNIAGILADQAGVEIDELDDKHTLVHRTLDEVNQYASEHGVDTE